MLGTVSGRVWKFGDNINSDLIHPSRFFSLDKNTVRRGAMKGIDPDFTENVKEGDIIVAGRNFGCGSGRETAVISLMLNGISVVVAESFARMFYRNAINLSLPVIKCRGISEKVSEGDTLEIDLDKAIILNLDSHEEIKAEDIPEHLKSILEKDGLMNLLSQDHKII
ncbi:MAG: 3-isopropylmalate dehydratase [Thermoplasmata archaeon]|nr:MAG: 3-isopropylmalate dehydratase [Thermoplasmata archaeon]